MTPLSLQIRVVMGSATVELSVPQLAGILGAHEPVVRERLLRHLRSMTKPVDKSQSFTEGKPTEGEERYVQSITFRSSIDDDKRIAKNDSTRIGEGPGEERRLGAVDNRLAEQIADALDDWEALAFLDRLTGRYPSPLLRRALHLTLAVPEDRLRTSRGAYFTGVVRALARAEARRAAGARSTPSPHAHA